MVAHLHCKSNACDKMINQTLAVLEVGGCWKAISNGQVHSCQKFSIGMKKCHFKKELSKSLAVGVLLLTLLLTLAMNTLGTLRLHS